jgi:hypothetical protein
MGYKFALILNREISDTESEALREAGCVDAVASTVTPPGLDEKVTQLDVDTEAWPTLAEAIDSTLAAVKQVSGLTVPTLTVPAQRATPESEEDGVVDGDVIEQAEASEAASVEAPEAAAEPVDA